ncbi:hypothetical protein PENTCL1PPCAC_15725, partial [Pristionchus entomophagus]
MVCLLLLLLILSVQVAAAAILSDLSKELLSEGLISLDDNGVPSATCLVTHKNGSTYVQTCPMLEGFGPRSVGCMAVWNHAGLMLQGCYSGQEISLRDQCNKRECVADRNDGVAVSFCCCHGALCNAAYA